MQTQIIECSQIEVCSAKPVLKWAGGKTQLLDVITGYMPEIYGRYFEPFIGSAALLLNTMPSNAFINDINEQLINLYRQLQTDVENVITHINRLDAVSCDKECYYSIREQYNAKIANHILDGECAALMIWINKHCFNGLYRVNSRGLFNVPYNNKINVKSIDENNLRCISSYLRHKNIVMTCLDFEEACRGIRAGDFVYFDSPYVPESETASFTDYTQDGFSLYDHKRLAALFHRLDGIGAKVMLSNNDVPFVRELYAGYNIVPLAVKRMINRDASKRNGKEVLIMNY